MKLAAVAATALSAALALSACTSPSDDGPAGPTPDGSSASEDTRSASAPARIAESGRTPPAPRPGSCYRLRYAELTDVSNDSEPVSCTARHNAQTVFVGTLDTVVDGHAVSLGSRRVQQQMAGRCQRKLASYLGGTQERLALSRFKVIWFSPTATEFDRGATWFRCDVVAVAGPQALEGLPAPGKLEGALNDDAALETYGLCGTSAPGEDGFERVICSRDHSWRAVAVTRVSGGRAYPGQAAVREAGDDRCRSVVSRLAGSADRFQYGWEWPTREQWSRGQHFGFCWAESG